MVKIKDIVEVSFNSSKFTLTKRGIVRGIPVATGDSWIIQDLDTADKRLHYISEGCTVTVVKPYVRSKVGEVMNEVDSLDIEENNRW